MGFTACLLDRAWKSMPLEKRLVFGYKAFSVPAGFWSRLKQEAFFVRQPLYP